MLKKVFKNAKKSIRELIVIEYKYLLSLFLIVMICYFPVDYYIIIGGGISDIQSRVNVEDGYQANGSLNLSYVTESNGTILTYFLSYIMPDWERESIEYYKYDEEETIEDISFRDNLSLIQASNFATKVAFETAKKEIKLIKSQLYVVGKMYDNEGCTLKVGDEILEIDGKNINEFDYTKYLQTKKANENIIIKIKRNSKEQEINTKLFEEDGKNYIGVYLLNLDSYETNPKVKLKFKKGESGPSAGLMTALSIYNQLVKEDITQGLTIAGTGTIDEKGNVGEIGGVKYKILGAVKGGADVFIVPSGENYKEVQKIVKERNLKIKVVEVSTFEETLTKLKELEK